MTLDEAIKHCEEVAEEQDKLCKRYDDASGYSRSHNEDIRTTGAIGCEVCAKEHRQLAGWLKELKALKEQQPCDDAISRQEVKDMLMREWTRYIPMDLDVNLSFVLAKVNELPLVKPQHTEAEIQKMQELEQSEIQKAYELGKAEMQPCEDAISREAVIDMTGLSEWFDSSDSYNEFVIALSNLPSVIPQPKTGHWIYIGNSEINGLKICKCSNCEKKTYGSHKFCPNCGANMAESEG